MTHKTLGESTPRQRWEEIIANRWEGRGDRAAQEHATLSSLWEAAGALAEPCTIIVDQIDSISVCYWDLEQSILALCGAIGRKQPTEVALAHGNAISEERWRKVWAYYLTLRSWTPSPARNGYAALLSMVDPGEGIQEHVLGMLGERTRLKDLYVERLCLCVEYNGLGGLYSFESAKGKAHRAAAKALGEEITKLDPEAEILRAAMDLEGEGKLQPCHHKAFRRYDIIISSIGCGKWRGAIPMRETDGFERAAMHEEFIVPIEAWIDRSGLHPDGETRGVFETVQRVLGEPDDAKVFLAALLVSVLRSQQLAAKMRAEGRATSQ